jgi:hypothetical protein
MIGLRALACVVLGAALMAGASVAWRLDWSGGGAVPQGPKCRKTVAELAPDMDKMARTIHDLGAPAAATSAAGTDFLSIQFSSTSLVAGLQAITAACAVAP